ncbi:unnamed protein product [Rotaria sordida]|uniref:PH domain-containing protein n=1 Tax=Rotaria sordida TaxID=392033 RepID=A0A813TMH4_9BILA|nr:unnamed protein product [Rotaria sordida]
MTTTTNISSNSVSFLPLKTSIQQTACNTCKRLLYSFEEILVCRVCHDSYHWRCVKPETVIHYGENENYICDKCNGGITTSPSDRITNGGIKFESTDPSIPDYRDVANIPSKTNSTETNVLNTIRYFEGKQQQSQTNKTTKVSELNGYLPLPTNEREYHQHNGQYSDGSRTTQRIQQQTYNGIESDNENDTTAMFQANYQYTPLKEYAALRGSQTTNDKYTNGCQNIDVRQTTSRYGGGLRYSNHGYDPTVSRLVEAPITDGPHFVTPITNNLPNHNREQHFVSTTNLNINEKEFRRQQQQQQRQQSSLTDAAPYLSQIRHDYPSIFKPSTQEQQQQQQQQQQECQTTVGSNSGIPMAHSNSQQQQQSNENQAVERKLTTLVQQLGKQLEDDAQKINEKLELKLKKFEDMINQQTYVIRQQDEVIERLKSKILKIETERDHFRDRLNVHEQREQGDKKNFTTNQTDKSYNQPVNNEQDNELNKKYSDTSTSTTDNTKLSTKKAAAPRVGNRWSATNKQNEPMRAQLVKNISTNRERDAFESSSAPTGPLIETPAASNRLDNIIHQSNGGDVTHRSSSNYSLAQVRRQDRPRNLEPVTMEKQQIVTSVHNNTVKQQRSNVSSSPSSSSSSSASSPPNSRKSPVKKSNAISTKTSESSNIHRSLESLPNTYKNNQGARLTNKASSLEFGTRPVQYDDLGSTYITPIEGSQSAIQSNGFIKGWLRKQNRDSFLKRIERYYCVLRGDTFLMYRHEHDRIPHKTIQLTGAKVLLYDDSKYGPSLELTWTNQSDEIKHYHLYVSNAQEADEWVTGIQTAIYSIEQKNHWRPYHLNA